MDVKENSYKIAAQNKKIDAMVAAIDRAARARGMDIYEDAWKIVSSLTNYTEQSWAIVDRVAKLKRISSPETRGKVIAEYRERADNSNFDHFEELK